jgi:hypothetical protein
MTTYAKDTPFSLMKMFREPYKYWQYFKFRLKVDNNQLKIQLIEKFNATKKTSSMSMDEYLTQMKDIVDSLEEIGIPLPKDVVVCQKNTTILSR